MPALTDAQEIKDMISETKRINQGSYEYYQEHFDELQDSHGGKIVAIVDTSVVDSIEYPADSETLQEFVESVREEHGDDVYMTHIPAPDQTLLL